MEITPLPSVDVSKVPFEQLAGNPRVPQSEKVKEAAKQFEAILVRQILTEARKTVISSSVNGDSNEKSIYDDMINNQMAESISHSGTLGLSKNIEAQLEHQALHKGEAPVTSQGVVSTTAHNIVKP